MYYLFKHDVKGYKIVKDGFNVWGFIFGIFYLLYKGLWKHSLLLFIAGIAVAAINIATVNSDLLTAVFNLGFAVFIGMQCNEWIKENYLMSGYKYVMKHESKEKLLDFIRSQKETID